MGKILLESLDDIHADFEFARKQWSKLGIDTDFDTAYNKYYEKHKSDDDWSDPVYSETAWNELVTDNGGTPRAPEKVFDQIEDESLRRKKEKMLGEALKESISDNESVDESISLGGGMKLPYDDNYCIFAKSADKKVTILKINNKKEFQDAERRYGSFINVCSTVGAAKSYTKSFTGPAKEWPVEVLTEGALTEGAMTNGSYSLYNGWVKVPDKDSIPDEYPELEPEYSEWVKRAESCETLEDIDNFIDDVYKLRQQGLLNSGEYGKENLIFKELRNNGYLQRLKDMKVEKQNQEMSLESLGEAKKRGYGSYINILASRKDKLRSEAASNKKMRKFIVDWLTNHGIECEDRVLINEIYDLGIDDLLSLWSDVEDKFGPLFKESLGEDYEYLFDRVLKLYDKDKTFRNKVDKWFKKNHPDIVDAESYIAKLDSDELLWMLTELGYNKIKNKFGISDESLKEGLYDKYFKGPGEYNIYGYKSYYTGDDEPVEDDEELFDYNVQINSKADLDKVIRKMQHGDHGKYVWNFSRVEKVDESLNEDIVLDDYIDENDLEDIRDYLYDDTGINVEVDFAGGNNSLCFAPYDWEDGVEESDVLDIISDWCHDQLEQTLLNAYTVTNVYYDSGCIVADLEKWEEDNANESLAEEVKWVREKDYTCRDIFKNGIANALTSNGFGFGKSGKITLPVCGIHNSLIDENGNTKDLYTNTFNSLAINFKSKKKFVKDITPEQRESIKQDILALKNDAQKFVDVIFNDRKNTIYVLFDGETNYNKGWKQVDESLKESFNIDTDTVEREIFIDLDLETEVTVEDDNIINITLYEEDVNFDNIDMIIDWCDDHLEKALGYNYYILEIYEEDDGVCVEVEPDTNESLNESEDADSLYRDGKIDYHEYLALKTSELYNSSDDFRQRVDDWFDKNYSGTTEGEANIGTLSAEELNKLLYDLGYRTFKM